MATGSVFRLCFGAIAFALVAMMPGGALAQRCSADTQCYDFGRDRTYCAGNTLVTRRSQCFGYCRGVEVSRVPCPGPCVGGRCIGGPLQSAPINPPSGGGLVAGPCKRVCTCDGKRLTYGVGYAKTAERCERRSVNCVYGCTCEPEPRCLKRGEV